MRRLFLYKIGCILRHQNGPELISRLTTRIECFLNTPRIMESNVFRTHLVSSSRIIFEHNSSKRIRILRVEGFSYTSYRRVEFYSNTPRIVELNVFPTHLVSLSKMLFEYTSYRWDECFSNPPRISSRMIFEHVS